MRASRSKIFSRPAQAVQRLLHILGEGANVVSGLQHSDNILPQIGPALTLPQAQRGTYLRQNIVRVLQSGHNVCSFAQYVEKPLDSLRRAGEYFRPRSPHEGEIKMSTMRGSAEYAGLLPAEPRDEPPPVRPTTLENDPFPNGQPSLRKRASRALSRFLITFCMGVAATLAWRSN